MNPVTHASDGRIELDIGGMTCASCANRIERKLNKLDGVTATVNYATEKARVDYVATCRPPTSSPLSKQPDTPRHFPHLRPPQNQNPSRNRIRPPRCDSVC